MLYRDDVSETFPCRRPGCRHTGPVRCDGRFVPPCHPAAAVRASYDQQSGEIRFTCANCQDIFARVAVAQDAEPYQQRKGA